MILACLSVALVLAGGAVARFAAGAPTRFVARLEYCGGGFLVTGLLLLGAGLQSAVS